MQEWLIFASEGEEEALLSLNEQAQILHKLLENTKWRFCLLMNLITWMQ